MSSFDTAYYLTNQVEGGYVNDPDDRGGETWRGVARRFWPQWDGWKIIDQVKREIGDNPAELNRRLDIDRTLQLKLKKFYRENFWNRIQGDRIREQVIANEVYDNAVHMGPEKSARYLQRTINVLNRNQRLYSDIKVDGAIGPVTLRALDTCVKVNGVRRTVNVINGYQMKHYLLLMERNPTDQRFIGWFDRVEVVWTA